MLNLNGTFFVQAINFFIAYLIIDRILLRAAVKEITADAQAKKQIKQAVQYEADTVKQLEGERAQAWQVACNAFAKKMPQIKRFEGVALGRELPDLRALSPQEIKNVIQQCADTVVQEVDHVR